MDSCTKYSLQTPEWLVFLRLVCAYAEGSLELVVGLEKPQAFAAATACVCAVLSDSRRMPTLCALAEGAADCIQAPHSGAAACVLAVLTDLQRRVVVLGGRDGMPRSLGSVYGGSVTRFLSGLRGGFSRAIAIPGVGSVHNGVAVSRDGSTLLVSKSTSIHIFSVHTGAALRTIGGHGSGPLQFCNPCQVWVASDGFVFVVDCDNNRVQVLTPLYDFHSFVGVGQLYTPTGVYADDDVVVVSERYEHRISVFRRSTGELLRRFGSAGTGDGELLYPRGLCFMPGNRHVAVADVGNNRVSVWTLGGEFVRHVGVGNLVNAISIACSDADELVVADRRNHRIVLFSASGEIVWTSEASAAGVFLYVAVHGSTIFGQTCTYENEKCLVFS